MRTSKSMSDAQPRGYPGEPGLWIFLLADMVTFAVFFVLVLVERAEDPELFRRSSGQLEVGLGALNTLLLLGGSLAVILAVGAARRGAASAPRHVLAAMACGVGFVGVKAFEWGSKIADGTPVSTNGFWQLYYALTGIHLLHVLIGIGVLGFVLRTLRSPTPNLDVVDGGACYWHLVDLLWLVLFSLLYLLG